ncbi:hypothetical protein [Roseovarius sp. Pro17]|uniref:hypothetical protein n=1 Tax=Roseovarius sp. Pro17 TaxID=3108175 RepID=UPI002D776FAC|nr:hypothetical protein [Roseovarius sp. Pro17]
MAMTAAATVTARIQKAQFLCIDLNMRPFFSCDLYSDISLWSAARLDLDQCLRSRMPKGDTQVAGIFACLLTVAL